MEGEVEDDSNDDEKTFFDGHDSDVYCGGISCHDDDVGGDQWKER